MGLPLRLLVVGAGLTGSLTASLLKQKFPAMTVTVWEKSRGAGGRFATNRCPTDARCMVDLGAQYISATQEYAKLHERYNPKQQTVSKKPRYKVDAPWQTLMSLYFP